MARASYLQSQQKTDSISAAKMKPSRSPSPRGRHTVRKHTAISTKKCRMNAECVHPVWFCVGLATASNKYIQQPTNIVFLALLSTYILHIAWHKEVMHHMDCVWICNSYDEEVKLWDERVCPSTKNWMTVLGAKDRFNTFSAKLQP